MNNDLLNLLACLRAIHANAWSAHWNSAGPAFYADHGLFERIYTGVVPHIDGFAEKLIANGMAVDALAVDRRANDFLAEVAGLSLVDAALRLERTFSALAKHALPRLQCNIGMDNFVRTLVDERSVTLYLLQQRAKDGAYGGFIGAAVGGGLSSVLFSAALGAGVGWAMVKYGYKLNLPRWEMRPTVTKGALIGGGLGLVSLASGVARGTAMVAAAKL